MTLTHIKRELAECKTETRRNRKHIREMEREWATHLSSFGSTDRRRWTDTIYIQLGQLYSKNRSIKLKARMLHILLAFYSDKRFLDAERYYYDPIPFLALKDNNYFSSWVERRHNQLIAINAAKQCISKDADRSRFERWIQAASYDVETKQYKLDFPRRTD